MASKLKLVVGIIAAALIAVAGTIWYSNRRVEDADRRAGLDATRVIDMQFERKVQLGVLHLTGTMVTQTQSIGCVFDWCTSTQSTRAPFSIDYSINLQHLPSSAYRWDSHDRIMFVEVPDVKLSAPNIDMARAQIEQGGIWISRAMGREMQQRAAEYMANKTVSVARQPENMKKAQDAARGAVAELVRAPLGAAGLGTVQVQVRLASDPRPGGYRPWDVSRPIAEVLADPRFR